MIETSAFNPASKDQVCFGKEEIPTLSVYEKPRVSKENGRVL